MGWNHFFLQDAGMCWLSTLERTDVQLQSREEHTGGKQSRSLENLNVLSRTQENTCPFPVKSGDSLFAH